MSLLNLCSREDRSRILRRRSWRKSAAKKRATNPDLCRHRTREARKKLTQRGYYRKGGKGYRPWVMTEKRRAYLAWYNKHVRKAKKEAA